MGLFDWFKKGRGSSKKASDKPIVEEPVVASPQPPAEDLKKLNQELELEKKRNKEQEYRMRVMEDRFTKMQDSWTTLLEKQQNAIETMSTKIKNSNEQPAPVKQKETEPQIIDDISRTISQTIVEDKTFHNFVVDDANRFPYLAAEAVATGVGRRYNPLFIYGDVGVGKTHLLHAIANKIFEVDQGFRMRYRNVDVLLIDDIQMLSGREATQKEFFHMFNHLYNSGKQIVLCSDRPPGAIKELENRLKSRFEGGLIIDINVPTFEGRRQILLNLAQEEGYSLSTEVLDYMAFYLDSSVRELEGGFNRVTAYASLMKEPITVSLIRKVLEGVLTKFESTKRIREEPREVLEETGTTVPVPSVSPYSDIELDLEEETDKLEQELLFELKKDSSGSD